MNAAYLVEADCLLRKHNPDDFDRTIDAFPECIEIVRAVEDTEAWKDAYSSVDDFYAAYEAQHPDIRFYGAARREIENADILTSPGGRASERLARLRAQQA